MEKNNAGTPNNSIHLPFGDECTLIVDSSEVSFDKNIFDELEYDCWELVKKYADYFGLEIRYNPGSDIDFWTAKQVQDAILTQFEAAGLKFVCKE